MAVGTITAVVAGVAVAATAASTAGNAIAAGNARKDQKRAAAEQLALQDKLYSQARGDINQRAAFAQAQEQAYAAQLQGAMQGYDASLGALGGYLDGQLTAGTMAGQNLQALLSGQGELTPGAQFAMEQGMQAAKGGAAARGTLNSGATMKELQRLGQGIAAQDYAAQVEQMARLQAASGQVGFQLLDAQRVPLSILAGQQSMYSNQAAGASQALAQLAAQQAGQGSAAIAPTGNMAQPAQFIGQGVGDGLGQIAQLGALATLNDPAVRRPTHTMANPATGLGSLRGYAY